MSLSFLSIAGLVCLLGGIALMRYNYSLLGFAISTIGIVLMQRGYKKNKQ